MGDVMLRPYEATDRADYEQIYEEAFPPSERKPLDFILSAAAQGRYRLWVVSTNPCAVAGLVILAYAHVGETRYALLDYLAVSPLCRGQGLGHQILPLIYDHCRADGTPLLLEIEDPDTPAENQAQRRRRKAFYSSCGLVSCGVKAQMYGTVMELLTYPEYARDITLEVYQTLVRHCYPSDMGIPKGY